MDYLSLGNRVDLLSYALILYFHAFIFIFNRMDTFTFIILLAHATLFSYSSIALSFYLFMEFLSFYITGILMDYSNIILLNFLSFYLIRLYHSIYFRNIFMLDKASSILFSSSTYLPLYEVSLFS